MHKILLIEPHQDAGRLIKMILLEKDGRKVFVVPSLPEATALLSSSRFDLIITEALGERSVFDFDPSFLDEIRVYSGDTPIILCSTYTVPNASDLGLAEVVTKPFSIDNLLRTVDRLLDKA